MSKALITATWDDVPHLSKKEKDELWDSIPPHERDARTKGIPSLGSGRVFIVPESQLKCEPFTIPDHWPRIGGLDFGWDHPTAAVDLAFDLDSDSVYVTKAYRAREATPLIVAGAVKPWGDWLPWAWPHDGLQHDKGSGEQLAKQYGDQGLNMLPERATFEDGTNGFEAGVHLMLTMMQTNRLKVFSHLSEWFEEYRLYHRKDGKVVKLIDDLLSATRYGIMMKRFAETPPAPRVGSGGGHRGGWMG